MFSEENRIPFLETTMKIDGREYHVVLNSFNTVWVNLTPNDLIIKGPKEKWGVLPRSGHITTVLWDYTIPRISGLPSPQHRTIFVVDTTVHALSNSRKDLCISAVLDLDHDASYIIIPVSKDTDL